MRRMQTQARPGDGGSGRAPSPPPARGRVLTCSPAPPLLLVGPRGRVGPPPTTRSRTPWRFSCFFKRRSSLGRRRRGCRHRCYSCPTPPTEGTARGRLRLRRPPPPNAVRAFPEGPELSEAARRRPALPSAPSAGGGVRLGSSGSVRPFPEGERVGKKEGKDGVRPAPACGGREAGRFRRNSAPASGAERNF